MFTPPQISGHNRQDPISKQKLESGRGQWAVRKEVIGSMVDGATRCIKLAQDRQSLINADLHKIVCMKKGVQFKPSQTFIGTIYDAN